MYGATLQMFLPPPPIGLCHEGEDHARCEVGPTSAKVHSAVGWLCLYYRSAVPRQHSFFSKFVG